jgi:hypothetical protein
MEAITIYGDFNRAYADDLKFWICGCGKCGEAATANNNLANRAGLEARRVSIPGEHAFIEVNINGEWLIPCGSTMKTRADFAQDRLRDPGSISYVIALTGDNSFVELTSEYVPTDTIKIQVTKNGEAVANAKVFLQRGGALPAQLPDSGLYFYTDVNGTITLHLGNQRFVGQYASTDCSYRIYVNDQLKGNITSTGNYTSRFLPIDIT